MRRPWALFFLIGLLSGCANIVDTKLMSNKSIFLTPGSTKTIYIQNRNISENQQVHLNDLGPRLSAKGYQVLQSPDQANVLLQTKIVYCNEAKESISLESVLSGGFGAGIGSITPGMGGDTGGMGMGGMPDINAMMAQAMREMGGLRGPPPDDTVLYFCAADVQVTEQDKGSEAGVSAKPAAASSSGQPNQIRVVAGVRQKKLDIEEATPIVREKLTTGIAGMF
jgi:hypothetical protein